MEEDIAAKVSNSFFSSISNSKLVEGLRFGRWFLGRTGEGRKTSSDLVLQCHSVAALRVRRIVKILQLYKEIYSEHAVVKFIQSYSASFKSVLNGKTILGQSEVTTKAGGTARFANGKFCISRPYFDLVVLAFSEMQHVHRNTPKSYFVAKSSGVYVNIRPYSRQHQSCKGGQGH